MSLGSFSQRALLTSVKARSAKKSAVFLISTARWRGVSVPNIRLIYPGVGYWFGSVRWHSRFDPTNQKSQQRRFSSSTVPVTIYAPRCSRNLTVRHSTALRPPRPILRWSYRSSAFNPSCREWFPLESTGTAHFYDDRRPNPCYKVDVSVNSPKASAGSPW